ncbi:MAG: SMP-30/gluconolactonase/LRE family protein [Fuerstiella sp.]
MLRLSCPAVLPTLLLMFFGNGIPAAEPIFPPQAVVKELWNKGDFTEGVAVRADGAVFFSDILRDPDLPGQILKFDPTTGQTTVFCADSGKSNGLFFDESGRLLACCGANGGAMALCEVTRDGRVRPLVERFNGKRLNAPNDLVVHPNGSVYFSDPRYIGPEPIELDHQSVYRYDLRTKKLSRATTNIQKPNGVHVSPDGKTLYVAETDNGSTGQDPDTEPQPGRMTLNAFDVAGDGTLSNKKVLVDFGEQLGIDGMTIDAEGRIYAAVRSASRFGMVVYSPNGKELDYLKTPSLPTNCCFGVGEQSTVLYITAGGGLYQVDLAR